MTVPRYADSTMFCFVLPHSYLRWDKANLFLKGMIFLYRNLVPRERGNAKEKERPRQIKLLEVQAATVRTSPGLPFPRHR